MVVITGRVSVKEEEAAKLVADQIVPIDAFDAAAAAAPPSQRRSAQGKKALYLKLPSRSCAQFHKVENLLTIFEGSLPVYMYFEDQKKLMLAPRNLWSLYHPLLIQELERVLGQGNVAIKDK